MNGQWHANMYKDCFPKQEKIFVNAGIEDISLHDDMIAIPPDNADA